MLDYFIMISFSSFQISFDYDKSYKLIIAKYRQRLKYLYDKHTQPMESLKGSFLAGLFFDLQEILFLWSMNLQICFLKYLKQSILLRQEQLWKPPLLIIPPIYHDQFIVTKVEFYKISDFAKIILPFLKVNKSIAKIRQNGVMRSCLCFHVK